MGVLQLIQLLATMAGAAKDISDVVTVLQAQGHPENAPIPPEHQAKVDAAIASVKTSWSPLGDPYAN